MARIMAGSSLWANSGRVTGSPRFSTGGGRNQQLTASRTERKNASLPKKRPRRDSIGVVGTVAEGGAGSGAGSTGAWSWAGQREIDALALGLVAGEFNAMGGNSNSADDRGRGIAGTGGDAAAVDFEASSRGTWEFRSGGVTSNSLARGVSTGVSVRNPDCSPSRIAWESWINSPMSRYRATVDFRIIREQM